jgi:hypothetical protein
MIKIVLIVLAILYALSPYDIVPDLFAGWGWLDDIVLLGLLWRYLYSQKRKQGFFKSYFQQNRQFYKNQFGKDYSQKSEFGRDDQFMKNNAEWDPHKILGIHRSASVEEIRKAYRQLANKYHPDKVSHLGHEFRELAERRFKEIQRAYQELKPK